ncbi:MAG TPA: peptidoglycan-binding protein [Acidimicrobiales bacterium]
MTLPLSRGDQGEAVRDLHRRLAAAGFPVDPPLDVFTDATRAAIEAFQRDRGLEVTGVCDSATWDQLVEAGYRLGDRLLYLQAPMLRGDDVAELQLRLSSLGFDAGRVDGIFGPNTERALAEFQRNAGLPTDGIAGRATISELCRLGSLVERNDPVAVVREREQLLRSPRELAERRVVVGDLGGLDALTTALGRALRAQGAHVLLLNQPDGSAQAAAANNAEAEAYVGVVSAERPCVAYFATAGFESTGGRRLAALCARAVSSLVAPETCDITGTRVPVLRETRMPAVLCRIGPPAVAVGHSAELAARLAEAISRWLVAPLDEG